MVLFENTRLSSRLLICASICHTLAMLGCCAAELCAGGGWGGCGCGCFCVYVCVVNVCLCVCVGVCVCVCVCV